MADIAGLKLIVPTSVSATGAGSSASVSASGKVTFTSAATLTIEGCFSASYDNYLIVCRGSITTSGQGIRARYRVSGSDASGTNYTHQYLEAEGTSVTGSRGTSQTSAAIVGWNNTHPQGFHAYFYGPYLAQPTASRGISVNTYLSATIADYAATHSLSTSYTGITFFPAANAISGALTIYGLSQ